ncbi:MAG: hypothetical protein ACRDOA_22275 [Streptosporangiaceae bacterium]
MVAAPVLRGGDHDGAGAGGAGGRGGPCGSAAVGGGTGRWEASRPVVNGTIAERQDSRFSGRAGMLREQLMRLLPLASGKEAARPLAAAGSAAGDCLAALEAVTAGLRDRRGMAGLAAHEAAAHLSGGLWLAPAAPDLRFSTTLLPAVAIVPS